MIAPDQTMPFIDRLMAEIRTKNSHVVAGLDPVLHLMPESLLRGKASNRRGIRHAIRTFNCEIIDAIAPFVAAVKPQSAFYEQYGLGGLEALIDTIDHAKRAGLIVIEDAKRNDIGSTAAAYAAGHLGKADVFGKMIPMFDVDAITVNPYLGSDGIIPFANDAAKYGKGVFILVKTSNPSSVELQDLRVVGKDKQKKRLYEVVAELVSRWAKSSVGLNGYSSIGAVVGATFPSEARKLRRLLPNCYFLVPGYGAQGGTAEDVVHCFNPDGYGALISASRSILYAYRENPRYGPAGFAKAAEVAVKRMRSRISGVLANRKDHGVQDVKR